MDKANGRVKPILEGAEQSGGAKDPTMRAASQSVQTVPSALQGAPITDGTDLVHGICGLATDTASGLVPILKEGMPAVSVLEGRRLELHVFAGAAEAAAFAKGVARAARNELHATVGRDGAERVVALEVVEAGRLAPARFEDSVDVVDHGGLGLQRASARWRAVSGSLPGGLALDIAPDGASVGLDVGPRRFALSLEWDEVTATTSYRANDWRVSTALMCSLSTSGLDFDAVEKVLRVRFPVDAFADRARILVEVDRLVAAEESRDEFGIMIEHIRRDPAHCRIVESMLGGWRLSSYDGSVVLVPPAGSERRLRPIAGSVIQRLIGADMIRRPRHADRRADRPCFSYEVGSLSGTAVRIPAKVSA
jgi:hypothetical protein